MKVYRVANTTGGLAAVALGNGSSGALTRIFSLSPQRCTFRGEAGQRPVVVGTTPPSCDREFPGTRVEVQHDEPHGGTEISLGKEPDTTRARWL